MLDHLVLFNYHRNDEITRFHFQKFLEAGPTIPLTCNYQGEPLPKSVDVKDCPSFWDCSNPWASIDTQIYKWAKSSHFIEAKRYIIAEWDCLLIGSLQEFYGELWNTSVVCNFLKRRGPDKWFWFKEKGNIGVVPLAGILLSNEALKAISKEVEKPEYKTRFCEGRLGSAAFNLGFEIKELRKEGFLHGSRAGKPFPNEEGLYHPIKECLK